MRADSYVIGETGGNYGKKGPFRYYRKRPGALLLNTVGQFEKDPSRVNNQIIHGGKKVATKSEAPEEKKKGTKRGME